MDPDDLEPPPHKMGEGEAGGWGEGPGEGRY